METQRIAETVLRGQIPLVTLSLLPVINYLVHMLLLLQELTALLSSLQKGPEFGLPRMFSEAQSAVTSILMCMVDNHHQLPHNCASSRVAHGKQVTSGPRAHALSHGGLGGAGPEDWLSVRYSNDS